MRHNATGIVREDLAGSGAWADVIDMTATLPDTIVRTRVTDGYAKDFYGHRILHVSGWVMPTPEEYQLAAAAIGTSPAHAEDTLSRWQAVRLAAGDRVGYPVHVSVSWRAKLESEDGEKLAESGSAEVYSLYDV